MASKLIQILFLCMLELISCLKIKHRIVSGHLAFLDNNKHQVSIRLRAVEEADGFGHGHICGGSLINYETVLTAAHCVKVYKNDEFIKIPPIELVIVMGSLDLFDRAASMSFDVRYSVPHEQFSLLANDIALIYLDKEVQKDSLRVKPIPLPTSNYVPNTNCRVSGWGLTSEGGEESQQLLTTDLKIFPISTCESIYPYLIVDGMMCAGDTTNGSRDSCQGDSGGPLVSNGILVGVVSWGYGCGNPSYPGVYTNTFYYLEWIQKPRITIRRYGSSSSMKIRFKVILIIFALNLS